MSGETIVDGHGDSKRGENRIQFIYIQFIYTDGHGRNSSHTLRANDWGGVLNASFGTEFNALERAGWHHLPEGMWCSTLCFQTGNKRIQRRAKAKAQPPQVANALHTEPPTRLRVAVGEGQNLGS